MSELTAAYLALKPLILDVDDKIISARMRKHSTEIKALLSLIPDAGSVAEAIYRCKMDMRERPICSCGGRVGFSTKSRTYSRFCSASCGQRDPEVRKKLKATNVKRYGIENVGGFGTAQHKAGIITKYGTRKERDRVIQEKIKNTNIEKYGVTNVFAAEVVKEKIVNTAVERYGVDHVMQVPHIKEKFRTEAGEWKPAVINVEVRKQRTLETITNKVRERLKQNQFELLSIPTGFSCAHRHTVKHLACNSTFEATIYSGNVPRCFTCEPLLRGTSLIQQKVEDFIKSLGIEIEVRNRKILNRKEIDILIPSAGIGFEVNGLYTHSELNGFSPKYHLEKTEKAFAKNIRLIHLFEDDIRNRWEVVQSMIKTLFQLNDVIYARNCDIKEVSPKEAIAFCEINHLKRSARFSLAVGLYYKNELVSCALFGKPRYSTRYDHELIRFCSKLNFTVIGGFSKIIKFFEKRHTGILLSYADRSYSIGAVYEKNGFTLERILPPNYWYFHNRVNTRTHPTQLRKYKLKRIYNDIDMNKTEWELLQERGWNRIWDCGQLVYVKKLGINK